MKSKLAKFLGIFILAIIIVGLVSNKILEGNSANCTAVHINSHSLLASNSKRSQIYLNGVWQFMPADSLSQEKPPQTGWGEILVPGDWQHENDPSVPGISKQGTGKVWENFNKSQLTKAWYQHTIKIPQNWQGRSLFIDISRVSTEAQVYVNGIKCGAINWPYGAVDISRIVKPGEFVTLAILVKALKDEAKKNIIMSPNEMYSTESKLSSRGLIGEVRLISLPKNTYISDVFVQPSTRKQQITLDVELAGVTQSGKVKLVAQMLNEKGDIEQEFTTTTNVKANGIQTIKTTWNLQNPRLWDVGKPNLYTLHLLVQGNGIDDEYNQQFGFREFWIEKQKFYLNGTEIRLRPTSFDERWQSWVVGIPKVVDRMIDGYFRAGFNIAELWPWNYDERGRWHFRELFAERADIKGFPLILTTLDTSQIASSKAWKNSRKRWEKRMAIDLRRYRNHPSILMWANSANFFGHSDDQNPRRIGRKKIVGTISQVEDKRMQEIMPIGEQAVATIKKYDSTRPVIMHQGASVGDVYALNSYLNMIPLQEREEWLSDWQQHGDMPYMVVEFGTPLHSTMMRGRNGFSQAVLSEPLMTEFSAIYLGKQAYELETSKYQAKISELFVKDQQYKNWYDNAEINYAPAFQKLQQLFSTNTWRSWRTFGITGGMVPWNNGHGWEISEEGKKPMKIAVSQSLQHSLISPLQAEKSKIFSPTPNPQLPTSNVYPFDSEQRGVNLQQVPKYLWYNLQPEANIIHPGGQAILQNNSSTLAWIAGSAAAFVAKDHNFTAGQKLQKQVVLINDTRSNQAFSVEWQVVVNGQQIAKGEKIGSIETSQTLFLPIDVDLPKDTIQKIDGEIRLKARIGNYSHQDSFAFRIFPKLPKANNTITVFDPVGKTTRMLQQLGYTVVPWQQQKAAQSSPDFPLLNLLIIGREALSSGYNLPGNLEAFVRNGGRVIAFTQNPEWMQQKGLRISPHQTRRVFPVNTNHPTVNNLDDLDLRDWTGESTLVTAYPNTLNKRDIKRSHHGVPWYGWHWGNRGTLSSVSVEKPHQSSWRPILESEFDLAYTPLMELDYGKGRLIWNTLDLEDHVPQDAAARQITQQIIAYAATAPISSKANKVILIGNETDKVKLDQLGLIYQLSNSLVTDAQLTIIGAGANIQDQELQAYLKAGGKLFFLPRSSPDTALGIHLQQVKDFRHLPPLPNWSEGRGISVSDLHSRVPHDAWLIQSGGEGEVTSNGLLSRIKLGKGVAIFCQIDPDSLNADVKTYFRYTRWRQTRILAQLLANLGASFKADKAIFQPILTKGNIFNFNQPAPRSNLYHPDYRTDFDLGDDPYRYYRW